MPELNQRLQQKLGLKISPAQMQLARLCELPNLQLEQQIKEELESNPALEADTIETVEGDQDSTEQDDLHDDNDADDESWDEVATLDDDRMDDDIDYPIRQGGEKEPREFMYKQDVSFRESLLDQLSISALNSDEKKVGEYIIGNIDEDGYLRREAPQLSDDLAFIGINAAEETVNNVINVIKSFEPAGIAASSLKECLILQLKRRMRADSPEDVKLAFDILNECFDEFSKKNYAKILKRFQCSEAELKAAMDVILKLNPKPGGSSYDDDEAHKITPDFILELIGGKLQLTLNSGEMPELRLSKVYLDMLEQYKKSGNTAQNREALAFIRNKLGSAKSFIDAVKQRNATLVAVMQAIMVLQKDFFLSNGEDSARKPMILKDVADVTGLDISTISRVANSKHVDTWFGTLALGDFFTGGVQNSAGEEVSVEEVKSALRDIIEAEDKSDPLNDDAIVKILSDRGYPLARRTVAKYRTALGIPVARLRRNI